MSNPLRTASLWGALGLWVALWMLPWQGLLEGLPWVRAVLGLFLLIVPGGCLAQLTRGDRSWARFVTVGFCVSIALTGILGILARLCHFSIDFVRLGLMAIGAAGIYLSWRSLEAPRRELGELAKQFAIAAPLIATIGLALHIGFQEGRQTDVDFATHHAQITDFRDAKELSFGHFIFGPEVRLTKRFWLSYWTLAEAVVAKNAGMHFIELYPRLLQLVLLIATLAIFALGRRMGLSRRWAYLACSVHLASISALWGETEGYRVGLTFYKYTLLDNNVATHIFAPVLLSVTADYLEAPDWRRLALLFLTAIGLLFTHAGMLGLFAVILAIYVALEVFAHPLSMAQALALGAVAAVAAIPASLRFVSVSQILPTSLAQALHPPRAVRILDDGVHYAIDPTYAMHLPFAFVALAGLVALFHVRRSTLARYILATILFLLIGMIPLTATLLGAAVTPNILGRSLWFMPFGLAAGFVLMALLDGRRAPTRPWLVASAYGVASLLTVVWMANGVGSGPRMRDEVDYTRADFVKVGRELDRLLDEPTIVLGDRTINNHLPTLSANAKNITHRSRFASYIAHLGAFPKREAQRRISDWKVIAGPKQPANRRIQLLRRNGARYFVTKERFDTKTPRWQGLQQVAATRSYRIYRIAPGSTR